MTINELIMSIIVAVMIGLTIVYYFKEGDNATKEWNNGKCYVCEIGDYRIAGTWRTNDRTHYLYECTECGHTFESYYRMK